MVSVRKKCPQKLKNNFFSSIQMEIQFQMVLMSMLL